MKVILDGWKRIIGLDGDSINQLKNLLTVYPLGMAGLDPPEPIFAFQELRDEFCVPREYDSLWLCCDDVVDKTVLGEAISGDSVRYVLREYQQEFVDGLPIGVRNGIICASGGYGKTIIGLEIIKRLGRRTMVVVHRECLRRQWEDAVKKFTGFILGRDVVVDLVQSLMKERYRPVLPFETFGCVIIDEVHHLSAPCFMRAMPRFPARYRYGLTMSVKRRDGTENIFMWHLGGVLGSAQKPDLLTPKIKFVKTGWNLVFSKKFKKPRLVNIMVKDARRNFVIMNELVKAFEAGRKILVLSERIAHLKMLAKMFEARTGCRDYDFYIGGIEEWRMRLAVEKRVLFGSMQFASEGVDLPPFSVLFLTTPAVGVAQACSRVLRDYPNKPQPVIVDFFDEEEICKMMFYARLKLYKKLGWM